MKSRKSNILSKVHKIPEIDFENQKLTSFGGMIIFQSLFKSLELKQRLKVCFKNQKTNPIFDHHLIVLLLITHLLLGYRRIRDLKYYENDPLIKRIIGISKLPDVSTISRNLSKLEVQSVKNIRSLNSSLVIDQLRELELNRITLDFDGVVIGTNRIAEGVATGYNKKKKGQRSYYPLFGTIAQTGHVLDVLHRSGNVHDSNGSTEFIEKCFSKIKAISYSAVLEARFDSAFFSEDRVQLLDEMKVEFTMTVPFERYVELKGIIEARKRWNRLDDEISYFEIDWKPKSWDEKYRMIAIRKKSKVQRKGVIQLDLFVPHDFGYEYKVIVTNKATSINNVMVFHNGRGAQESFFGELQSQGQMGYIPFRRLVANQTYLLSSIMAYNLNRIMQISVHEQNRNTTFTRASLWVCEKMDTIRNNILRRAGRFTKPSGKLKLTISGNEEVAAEIYKYLENIPENVPQAA